jgi:Zn-dependent protease with chaperone function
VTSAEALRRLQELEADQVALSSTQEKLSTTVKRLTSRAGMRELRDQKNGSSSDPPRGTSKADLLRHYGMSGKVGPEFAQAQLDYETRKDH